jgi:type IV pilus assembly protein PilB
VGLSFSNALRTLLRQDPDIIMLGEIRDEETARTAIQAALTGHLVFSTLHTNDAPSAVTRLINMGIEPYLLGAALNTVLAQRLVRRICPKCRGVYEPPRTLRKAIGRMGLEIERFYKGIGCRRCRNTGFAGRVAIHELLAIDDQERDAITAGASAGELRRLAGHHLISLAHDGFRKVAEGVTTIEEVLQVVGEFSAPCPRPQGPDTA